MKTHRKRGIPMPTRIIISALLILVQIGFLFAVLYDY